MGMIDSVQARCDCGRDVYFQSKSGPCHGDTYLLSAAPSSVLWSANANSPHRCDCGKWLEIDANAKTLVEVADPAMEGPKVIRISDGKVMDFRHAMAEPGEYTNYFGNLAFGEVDTNFVKRLEDGPCQNASDNTPPSWPASTQGDIEI